MSNDNTNQNKVKTMLTVHQTAQMLGVSPATIRKWQHQGKIPYFKIFGAVRFELSELENLLKRSKLILDA